MKKALATTLAIAVLIGLAGCGGGTQSQHDKEVARVEAALRLEGKITQFAHEAQAASDQAIQHGEDCIAEHDYRCVEREATLSEQESDIVESQASHLRALHRQINSHTPQAVREAMEAQ